MASKILDVIIIGAGVSGIGAACHLRRMCPDKSFAILERREAIGGTWDLFRYPGIRSDSDMFTFGYKFKPWTEPRVLADGPAIRAYVTETAKEHGVDQHIHFGRKVSHAEWSSRDACWHVDAVREADGVVEHHRARFLIGCTGYYNYDAGFSPRFEGEDEFAGTIVHPQHWPDRLDFKGKNVVVIGSGATAITLVPAMTEGGAHVTMLQRSPSYIMTVPAIDPAHKIMRLLPEAAAYHLTRARNVGIMRTLYRLSRAQPKLMRRLLLAQVRLQLGDSVSMRHFTPNYAPWDERLCVVPNGDLFRVLREGRAAIVTDHIERFTREGVLLKSGETLRADIIVKATGLDVQMLGGVGLHVDGAPVRVRERMIYRGVLVEGVPNAAMVFGYTNASWTLKVDLSCEYLCRLLMHMDRHGHTQVVPRDHVGLGTEDTVMGSLSSGYIRRAVDRLPRQGRRYPWRVFDDYVRDAWSMRGGVDDDALEFSHRSATAHAADAPEAAVSPLPV